MVKGKAETLTFILLTEIFIDNKNFELPTNFINRSITDVLYQQIHCNGYFFW